MVLKLLAALALATAATTAAASDGDALSLEHALKADAKAGAAALASAVKAKLRAALLHPAAAYPTSGWADPNTPLALVSARNGSTTRHCERNAQCIDASGPGTFGDVAALPPTLALSTSTPWTDASDPDRPVLNISAIPYVEGAVPASAIDPAGSIFSVSIEGDRRVLRGNGLPSTPMGSFPVASTSAAYEYYSSLPGGTNPATGQPYQPNGTADEIYVAPYNLTSVLPAHPKVEGAFPVDSLIVGVTLTGAVWHAECASDSEGVYYSPTNVLPMDACWGHPYANQYHLHGYSWKCLPDQGGLKGHSPLFGYALDGFGIYGPRDVDGAPITNAELDKCHGHVGWVAWDGGKPAFMYHYHLNAEFPFSVGCFRGSVDYFRALGSVEMRETLLPIYSKSYAATKLLNARAEVSGAAGVAEWNETTGKVGAVSGFLTAAAGEVERVEAFKFNGTSR